MLDLLYVVITIAFFILSVAYVAACERLSGSANASAERRQP
jgi:hypothetical protein